MMTWEEFEAWLKAEKKFKTDAEATEYVAELKKYYDHEPLIKKIILNAVPPR